MNIYELADKVTKEPLVFDPEDYSGDTLPYVAMLCTPSSLARAHVDNEDVHIAEDCAENSRLLALQIRNRYNGFMIAVDWLRSLRDRESDNTIRNKLDTVIKKLEEVEE